MSKFSISIIIPAYNVEKYLKIALDSVKYQTELPDEVILVDDGSIDETLKIAKECEFPVPYRVISIKNGGQGNARNVGVREASSEYVYFFDSDDMLKDNFIKSIKKELRQNEFPDIVLFSGESFNDSEYKGSRWANYCRSFSGVFSNRAQLLDQAHSHNSLFCSPCLYVSRKSLWGPEGLEFGLNFLEDEALFFPLLFACSTFVVLEEVFFLRRNREGSTMTMTPNAKHVNGARSCMETTFRLYSADKLTSRERWHISKKLESHCIAYIVMARRAGVKMQFSDVLEVIWSTKSWPLALKAFLFGIRADQSDMVRRVGRMFKRIGGLTRG